MLEGLGVMVVMQLVLLELWKLRRIVTLLLGMLLGMDGHRCRRCVHLV